MVSIKVFLASDIPELKESYADVSDTCVALLCAVSVQFGTMTLGDLTMLLFPWAQPPQL